MASGSAAIKTLLSVGDLSLMHFCPLVYWDATRRVLQQNEVDKSTVVSVQGSGLVYEKKLAGEKKEKWNKRIAADPSKEI